MREPFSSISSQFYMMHNFDPNTVESQYRKLLLIDWKDKFDNGTIPNDPVTFWTVCRDYKNSLNENCFEELADTALTANCLPISNAVVERIFSYVTNVKNKQRKKLTTNVLSAIIRMKSRLHFSSNCCKIFVVTVNMLSLFNKVHQQMYIITLLRLLMTRIWMIFSLSNSNSEY